MINFVRACWKLPLKDLPEEIRSLLDAGIHYRDMLAKAYVQRLGYALVESLLRRNYLRNNFSKTRVITGKSQVNENKDMTPLIIHIHVCLGVRINISNHFRFNAVNYNVLSKIVRICIYRMPPYIAEITGVSKVNAIFYIYFQPVSFISLCFFFSFIRDKFFILSLYSFT